MRKELLTVAEEMGAYFLGLCLCSFADSRAESILNLLIWKYWVNCAAFCVLTLLFLV